MENVLNFYNIHIGFADISLVLSTNITYNGGGSELDSSDKPNGCNLTFVQTLPYYG